MSAFHKVADEEDLDRIMAVMDAAFDPNFGEAWSRRQVADALVLSNCHHQLFSAAGTGALRGEPAAGFFLSRMGVDEEELLLFAVTPEQRGRGIGAAMLRAFAAAARTRGAERLLLEMRRGNPAERLYRAFGFATVGQRSNYYRCRDGSRLDAITFACALPPAKVS